MKIYLLLQGLRGVMNAERANAFFFKRSAIAAARRIRQEGGEWRSVFDHDTSATDFWVTSSRWMSVVPILVLFRDWSFKRWLRKRCDWQNLNERKDGSLGPMWRYGRVWFYRAYKPDTAHRERIRFLWRFFGRSRWLGASMDLFAGDNNRDVSFSLGLWFCSFYLTFQNLLPARFGYPHHCWYHETCFRIMSGTSVHGPAVSIHLHHAGADCMHCGGWKGYGLYWWPLDSLLGAPVYTSKILDGPAERGLFMDSRLYPVRITLTQDTWKRPRWPLIKAERRARIECLEPIPTPGKGENSWDCRDDARHGLTCEASTFDEALIKLRLNVLRDRERYGGKDWKPASLNMDRLQEVRSSVRPGDHLEL